MKNVEKLLHVCIWLSVFYVYPVKSNFELAVGEKFTIELPLNPSTGYTWIWQVGDDINKRIVELINKEYTQPAMPGGNSTVKLTFQAMSEGSTLLVLNLKRIWLMNDEIDQRKYDVTIHAKKMRKKEARQ